MGWKGEKLIKISYGEKNVYVVSKSMFDQPKSQEMFIAVIMFFFFFAHVLYVFSGSSLWWKTQLHWNDVSPCNCVSEEMCVNCSKFHVITREYMCKSMYLLSVGSLHSSRSLRIGITWSYFSNNTETIKKTHTTNGSMRQPSKEFHCKYVCAWIVNSSQWPQDWYILSFKMRKTLIILQTAAVI